MTLPEQIMRAVAILVDEQGATVFTREQVRAQAGITPKLWDELGSLTFQGMRIDHPGGAAYVDERYRHVFRRVAPGQFILTAYGEQLLKDFAAS